jgi:hypothetical protein
MIMANDEITPRKPISAVEEWLSQIYEALSEEHGDGITPVVTITPIAGGHNVAFSYGEDDPRNTDFDVLDGTDGTDGYTPVRGTDYWTAQDVSDMEAYCASYIDTEIGVVLNAGY